MQSTYLKNRQQVKTNAENARVWYNFKLADVYAIQWCELQQ